MAALLLPGRNQLVLCPAALCSIVEQHLRDANYGSKESLSVTAVAAKQGDGTTSYHFTVTTGEEVPRG